MTPRVFVTLVTGLALNMFLFSQHAEAEAGLDVDYAEHQPLASESILLDVTSTGNGYVAVGERGHVLISNDGQSWEQAEVVPTRSTLTSVTEKGGRLWAGGHDAIILTSGDGGDTWSRQYFDPDRQQAVMAFLFTDDSNGVAIGSYGLLLRTSDGGQTWEDDMVDEENDYHLNSMIRFDDGRRFIAGEAGFSYRSYDDGASWEMVNLPYLGSMWGAAKTPGDCILIYGLRGHVMESCDFGMSWNEIETGIEASLSGYAEQDGIELFAGNSGTLLIRSDGQVSDGLHSSGVDFSAVIPIGNGQFLLVGEDGVHYWPEPEGAAE